MCKAMEQDRGMEGEGGGMGIPSRSDRKWEECTERSVVIDKMKQN